MQIVGSSELFEELERAENAFGLFTYIMPA